MGVPISFLDKYNPDQFEILGATESEGKGFSCGLWNPQSGVAQAIVNGARVYKRLFYPQQATLNNEDHASKRYRTQIQCRLFWEITLSQTNRIMTTIKIEQSRHDHLLARPPFFHPEYGNPYIHKLLVEDPYVSETIDVDSNDLGRTQ